jgi:hypothetical protein
VAVAPTGNLASAIVTATLALNAPTGVLLTQVPTGLQIGWTDNSNNETGFEVVRTQIQVDPLTGLPLKDPVTGAYVPATTLVAGVATPVAPLVTLVASTAAQKTAVAAARTYIDTTATAGLMYAYVVRAVSTTGVAPAAVTVRSADSTPIVTGSRSLAAPSAPTAAITNATRITVSWTDLSTTETGFIVERLFTPAVPVAGAAAPVWTVLATVARTAAQGTAVNGAVSYIDNLVAPVAPATLQGTYQYRVTAVNQSGVGVAAVTNGSSVVVTGNVLNFSAPVVPSNVTALPASTIVAGVVTPTAGTVNVGWTDASLTETAFSVQYVAAAAVVAPALPVNPFAAAVAPAVPAGTVTRAVAGVLPGTGLTGALTLTGLVKGTTYFVRVGATNLVGTTYSTAVSVVAP